MSSSMLITPVHPGVRGKPIRRSISPSGAARIPRRLRSKTIQPLETGIVSAIYVHDGDKVTAGEVLVELDRTVTQAERKRVGQDLIASLLDVARLAALRHSFNDLAAPHDIEEPAGASEAERRKADHGRGYFNDAAYLAGERR